MSKPKVIFLDAVGTLFDVKGGVGQVYSAIAQDFGVTMSSIELQGQPLTKVKEMLSKKLEQISLEELKGLFSEEFKTILKVDFLDDNFWTIFQKICFERFKKIFKTISFKEFKDVSLKQFIEDSLKMFKTISSEEIEEMLPKHLKKEEMLRRNLKEEEIEKIKESKENFKKELPEIFLRTIFSKIYLNQPNLEFQKRLKSAFFHCLKNAPPLAFPEVSPIDIPEKEYYWWHDLVKETFEQTGALPKFDDFGAFFQQLYAYFTTPDPWIVYPDILPSLEKWRRERIELGIISNFDSRLHGLIGTLELEKYFTSITISSAIGAAKPEAKIFEIALKKHECQPENAWHIGDSVENDYKAAKAAGLRSFLLDRNHKK